MPKNQRGQFSEYILPTGSRRRALLDLAGFVAKQPRLLAYCRFPKKLVTGMRLLLNRDNGKLAERARDLADLMYDKPVMTTHHYAIPDPGKIEIKPLTFPLHPNPLVSIIVPVFNQCDYTYTCLETVLRNTASSGGTGRQPGSAGRQVAYEIIVADDHSTDRTVDLAHIIHNVSFIRNDTNLGFIGNCNQAGRQARGKYLVMLNNDTLVQPNWLQSMVALAEADERVGLVGARLVSRDGSLQEAGGIVWNDGSAWNYGRNQNPDHYEYNYVKEVDYCSGACLLVRKLLWDRLGGFAEEFKPAYYEDADLAFRARQAGFTVMYQPQAVVVHLEGITQGINPSQSVKQYQRSNRDKFFCKWQTVLQREHGPAGHQVFRRRDRSHFKKIVLVIDHQVPAWDRDAGSRSTSQYLDIMLKLGYKLVFYPDNGYRSEPYTMLLQQRGVEVIYDLTNDDFFRWLDLNGGYLDYVFLNRPQVAGKYLNRIRAVSRAKIIFYGVDLHSLREKRRYAITPDQAILQQAKQWEKLESLAVSGSDITWMPSEAEVSLLRDKFPDRTIRLVPVYSFDPEQCGGGAGGADRNHLFFIGSFNHPPNRDGVTWFLDRIFPLISRRLPEVKFILAGMAHGTAGSDIPSEIQNRALERVEIVGHLSDEELRLLYDTVKISVAPVRFGAGVKGKILEAMARGVPVVTTTIGLEGIVDGTQAITVADDPEGFCDAVVDLYRNQRLWEQKRQAGLDLIRRHFSRQAAETIVREDFSG